MTKSKTGSVGRTIGLALLVVLLAVAFRSLAAQPTPDRAIRAADEAWGRGDYIAALTGYLGVLNGSVLDAQIARIAETTGELYRTHELTDDGRNGRFSPDGRFIVYETGLETSRRSTILRNDETRTVVSEIPGISVTFTPDGSKVAFLRTEESAELLQASAALEATSLTAGNRGGLVQAVTWLQARDSVIVVRELSTGRDVTVPAPGLVKAGLAFAEDGQTLFFLGASPTDPTRTDIYRTTEGAPAPTLAVDAAGLKGVPLIEPSALVYVVPTVSPLRRPTSLGGPAAPQNPPAAGRAPAAPRFVIVERRTGRTSTVVGASPSLSADGRTIAYVARDGANFVIKVGPTTGEHPTVLTTSDRLDAPALSFDGRRVAWQQMPRDDWEIFVADVAGVSLSGQQRVTREVQHDVLPQFLTGNRIVGMVGEARHRRAYLYEPGVAPKRLFHNNTVRTIAPEYQWVHSPDGSRVIIGAERDGDTVSPKRGVYLVDLTRTVTKTDLVARLRGNLALETGLRDRGVRAFRPIAMDVRETVGRASVSRVFGYEKSLFDFDSKDISRPGNRQAAEFLFETYKSFGYEPEYQWFERRNAAGGRTANVVATLRGTVNPELVYVISSHYDSVPEGPGADDDSSGTAALLEAARVLAGHPQPATIVFASMTGEEEGLLGSREFVRRSVEAKTQIVGALNNDMVGWMNDQRLDNTIRYSNSGIRDVQHAAAMLFTSLITYDALYWKGTDAMSFYDVYGDVVGGIGSYPVLGSPHYHQETDLLDTINHQLVTETSKATVATIMLMASSPSRLTGLTIEGSASAGTTVSWKPSPEKNVVSYIVGYGLSGAPLSRRITTARTRVTLPRLAAGTLVSVKAVNARGLEGWDWARVKVGR